MRRLCDILFGLSAAVGVSGREGRHAFAVDLLRAAADEVWQDTRGNIIARKRAGKIGAKKMVLDAHLDEVGLIVQRIDDDGFIHFVNHTRLDAKILPASDVVICADTPIRGVVGAKPPHLQQKEEQDMAPSVQDLAIDVGMTAEQARRHIRVGDMIALQGECAQMLGSMVRGKSFDNRALVAVLISVMEQLKQQNIDTDLYVVLSVGEEFGGYGAKSAVQQIKPDEVIVLDVSFGMCPDAKREDCAVVGKGPMLGISPILRGEIYQTLASMATAAGVSYQVEAMPGKTGTNCDKIAPLHGGLAVQLISLPLRYMHTAQEVVSLEDMAALRKLLVAYITGEVR